MDFLEVPSWTPFSLCTLYLRELVHSHEFKYKLYASTLSGAQVRILSSKYKLLTRHVVTTVCITDISNSVSKTELGSPAPQLLHPHAPLLGLTHLYRPRNSGQSPGSHCGVSPTHTGIHRQVLVILPRES